ncbi:MAG: hypothetical protein AB8E82_11405 [Aureispira sp.]
MEAKLKKLDSLKKLDYSAYEKLLKTAWPDLMTDSAATFGYSLVDGQHLPWKNVKPTDKPHQPMLYVGPITKWKTELNGSSMDLKGYSYGACKVVPVGQAVHVYLSPEKGKLTDEKLLKPIKKVLKKFKPKVFLEVVADLSTVEVEPQTRNIVSDDAPIAKVVQKLAQEIQQYHLATNKVKKLIAIAKPEEKAKLQVKYQSILRKLKHVCGDWKEQIVPQTEAASKEQAFGNGQKIFQHWQGFFDKRQAAKAGQGDEEGAKAEEERLYTKFASNIQQFYANLEKGEALDVGVIETNINNLKNYYARWQQFVQGKQSSFEQEMSVAKQLLADITQSWPKVKPLLTRSAELYKVLEQAADKADGLALTKAIKELEQIDEKLKTV